MDLYQVNGDSNEEYGDNDCDKCKKPNPYYLYLDSCPNYHKILKKSAKEYLQNIRASDNTLCGNCNTGFAMSEEMGDYRNLYMWVMEHGIKNIRSMGFLKKCYKISYETSGIWIVTTPSGKHTKFKRGMGEYYGMPYIDMRKNTRAAREHIG